MNQDFCPSYPMEQMNCSEYDQHQQRFSFVRNHQIVSSSSSSSLCHIISNPTQDHAGFYHPQLFQPHHHPEDEYYGYGGGSSYPYERENRVENGLKLSLRKKEDEDSDGVKWISVSKKKGDPTAEKVEVKKVKLKLKRSSSLETNLSSHSLSYNCNTTIRVCSDCHTTKTPLWRSGPKGPKSLCNACGIRQRKARRAMATRAGNGGGVTSDPPPAVKKRCKLGAGSSTSSGKKMDFEDFLINLSNKLAFNRVFPQDEKEAAILLMALSSGLVHG